MSSISSTASLGKYRSDDKHPQSSFNQYRRYHNTFNAVLALVGIIIMLYGLVALGTRNTHNLIRWFAIDLMVQGISIKIASDLIPHGISVPGQNAMDTGVGAMLIAMLALVLMGDITGISISGLWYLIDGAQLALFLAIIVKYLVTLVV
jgi:hypothetical protein